MIKNIKKEVKNIVSTNIKSKVKFIHEEINELKENNDIILNGTRYTKEYFYKKNMVKYKENEKIRIVFLFQVASFWPSWESVYNYCIKDGRFDVKVVLFDKIVGEKSQMLTARKFLKENKIEFVDYKAFDIDVFKPHVMVFQTPYDIWHRPYELWSDKIKIKGIRIVYILYGIEISDTDSAREAHFRKDVIENSWRIYTFSKRMLLDYKKYCWNYKAVRALGQPKFDSMVSKECLQLNEDLLKKINGRKIFLWKVHFPKKIIVNDKGVMVTPYLEEYVKFAEAVSNYPEIFFIFMPHPKFVEMCGRISGYSIKAKNIYNLLQNAENAYICEDDDYRPTLVNADYIIVDRSALMVEAGAVGVPVLYMKNADYDEPVTAAIKPLIDSYYDGYTAEDMINFLNSCKKGEDPKKEERENAFRKCIPYFDGKCGERIGKDIYSSITREKPKRKIEEKNKNIINNLLMNSKNLIGNMSVKKKGK